MVVLLLKRETVEKIFEAKEKTNLDLDEFLEKILEKSKCIDIAQKFIEEDDG